MGSRSSGVLSALFSPANTMGLAAAAAASAFVQDPAPAVAAGIAAVAYAALLAVSSAFRRAVRANAERQTALGGAAAEAAADGLLAELAPSQREHYASLRELKERILERYARLPGGRVLVAASERRLEGLLSSFLRLVATLNSYRKFLSASDRKAIADELAQLEAESAAESNERLREVKARRSDILRKRLQRFVQAEESRELVSHQLASIEDVLNLTHEQAISIRDPELVGRQLEALTNEVAETEETVRELESFTAISDELAGGGPAVAERARVR